MRFSAITTALALVASAVAQTDLFDPITDPKTGEVVTAGSTYNIKWQSTRSGKLTVGLIGGESPSTLIPIQNIATGVDSTLGTYAWAVDASLGKDKTYGIQLTLESDTTIFQYGFPFVIKGSGSASNSSSTGYSTSTSSKGASSGYPTSSSYSTMYPTGNLSTTASPTKTGTTITNTIVSTSTASRASTAASSVSTAAAPSHLAGGALALVGGIAAAVFAL